MGKLKNNYGSLMVALFFVASSLLGFSVSKRADIVKESSISDVPAVAVRAADISSVVSDVASVGASSGAFLSTTTAENTGSFSLSAPEFLFLGEVKDPGVFTNVALNQSGTVVYEMENTDNSPNVASLALRLEQRQFSL